MIRSEVIGTYPAANAEYIGFGYIASYLSAFSVAPAVVIQMICAGIVLTPRISANVSLDPRIDADPTIEQC